MNFSDTINELPPEAKAFFLSDDLRIEMEKACFLYGVKSNIDIIRNIKEEAMSDSAKSEEFDDDEWDDDEWDDDENKEADDSNVRNNDLGDKTEEANDIPRVAETIALVFSKRLGLSDLPDSLSEKLQLEKSSIYGLSYELNKRIFTLFPDVFQDSQSLLTQWENLKAEPKVPEEEATKMMLEMEPWILEDEKEEIKDQRKFKEEEETQKKNIKEVTISEGLKKYPEVGEQIITSQHIRLKIFPEPVRPSIKNWLSDYTFGLGYESHDAMTRGDYLFKSENSRGLSQKDRERLSLILKSYDENIPLTIDTSTKQVLFPENQVKKMEEPEAAAISEPNNLEPIAMPKADIQESAIAIEPENDENEEEPALEDNNMKFSSPQIFANEKEIQKAGTSQPIRISPASRERPDGYYQKEKDIPGNIVDLKRRS